jgi:hypothetical protein
MRSYLEVYSSCEPECLEAQEVLRSWMHTSLVMFDQFKSHMEKFSEENCYIEVFLTQQLIESFAYLILNFNLTDRSISKTFSG